MESRELFLLLHLLPFLLVSRVGSDKKAPLSLSLFLPLLPAFSSCKWIQCSRSSTLAVLTPFGMEFKRRVFSRTPPPLFLTQEKRGRVVVREGGGADPPLSFTEEPRHCSLCALQPPTPAPEPSGPTDVSRSERRIKWQLWHRQQGLQAPVLRDEIDQILNCISQACTVTAPSPSSSTKMKYSFPSGPPRGRI